MVRLMKPVFHSLIWASLSLSSPAFADMTATYVGTNVGVTMKIEIASNGDVRGATSSPNAYFITHEGKGYVVQATFDGPAVMRVEDMATVLTEQIEKFAPELKLKEIDAPNLALTKGGVVTVRGRQGVAYFMGDRAKTFPDAQPVVVVSTDPALAPLASAMEYQFTMSITMMGRALGPVNPFSGMQAVLKTGAPIVFSGMELDTVSYEAIPASRFVLPAEPLSLEDVRKNMGATAS